MRLPVSALESHSSPPIRAQSEYSAATHLWGGLGRSHAHSTRTGTANGTQVVTVLSLRAALALVGFRLQASLIPCAPSVCSLLLAIFVVQGTLIREVDALGGLIGRVADQACIAFRVSRQAAVCASCTCTQ